jgi:hypothetical protein
MISSGDPFFLPMLALLCVMLVLLLPGIWLSSRLGRRLQANHPDTWQRLGQPSLRNLSIASSSRTARFLRAREYRGLADPVVNRCVLGLRIVAGVHLTCFLAFFALFTLRAIFE